MAPNDADTPETRSGHGTPTDAELRNLVPRGTADREFRVGIFLILGVVSFMSVLYLMTEPAMFRGRYFVETVVDDARGIRRGDPIQLLGVNVGRVAGFDLQADGGSVAVLLEVEGQYRIPTGSTALLEATSALGGVVVRIEPGPGPGTVEDGARIPGRRGGDFMATLESAGAEAEATFAQVQALLADSTVAAVHGSAAAMQTLLENLDAVIATQSAEVTRLTNALTTAAERVAEATPEGEELSGVLSQADSVLRELRATSATLGEASGSLRTVLSGLERGEGTLGLILRDEALYRNLNAALESVEALATDLRERPGRYLTIRIF